MARTRFVVTVAVAAVLAFAAPSLGDTYRIRAGGEPPNWTWEPDFRHIIRGDRIVWKNPTGSRHNVRAYAGRWNMNATLEPGARVRRRFRRVGTYKYRCTIPGHSKMVGNRCEGQCGEIHVARP